ncbi:uncharacterized protein PFLUO_LOCUS7951 [Penicillium psychrofluorescens]|uniref:uncharacterized protein n=1 Tax=Penicillium psychrofluorescens TaxID=3158075 RepID=UPI003CCE09F1
MDLPSPTFSFTIPSIHDGCKLECRLYLPRTLQHIEQPPTSITGAIIAHPYGPLGGCYDDPVVSFVGGELLDAGCVVGTFNFRGAGGSEGRTSWTARPELRDYLSFYGFMLQYLHLLHSAFAPKERPPQDATPGIRLILGGYSYGSLVVSHVPTADAMIDLFQSDTRTASPSGDIGKTAKTVATRSIETLHISNPSSLDDASALSPGNTQISYLLVSPLLPPVSQLLTVFSTLSLNRTSAQGRHIASPRSADQLSTHRSLALFGDSDTFTSARKLQRWSDELAHVAHSQFQYRQISGAGHFWREDGVEMRARHALREWLMDM